MAVAGTLPQNLVVQRAQTQKDVNYTLLAELASRFADKAPNEALDVPCGNMEFITYVHKLFPSARVLGADIMPPRQNQAGLPFKQMDASADFTIPADERYDLITSVSGIMMFSNTAAFVKNCVARLKSRGTFVITNDNSATIIDRLAFLFLSRYRLFRPIYDDGEDITQNVPIQEVVRLMRRNGIEVENITYTSFYPKDLIYLPFALLVYPIQKLYLRGLKTDLPKRLLQQMYPFNHLFCKHYIVTGVKVH